MHHASRCGATFTPCHSRLCIILIPGQLLITFITWEGSGAAQAQQVREVEYMMMAVRLAYMAVHYEAVWLWLCD